MECECSFAAGMDLETVTAKKQEDSVKAATPIGEAFEYQRHPKGLGNSRCLHWKFVMLVSVSFWKMPL